jgi:hypothetical protein
LVRAAVVEVLDAVVLSRSDVFDTAAADVSVDGDPPGFHAREETHPAAKQDAPTTMMWKR